ncbi:MAG TPA: hypothetical protein V6C99_05945 [Oculatellaceae cyanobacterium]|jgi:Zn finger protein HypA/HybF involved in hydrogenase expression
MQLLKALAAFYQTLLGGECEHPRVQAVPGQASTAGYCPDCGYKVLLMWTLCRCRTCGSKRHPSRGMDGKVRPLYRYCQHCGQMDYQIIKRNKINIHEMPYAILTKEVDYSEERLFGPKKAPNPFEIHRRINIVEGEVLHKEAWSFSRRHG